MEWYFVLLIILGGLIIAFPLILISRLLIGNFMKTIPTSKLTDNIYAIKTSYVNCFIYSKDSHKILIDTGTSIKAIRREMKKLNLNVEEFEHVFLTHNDPDHAGSINSFPHASIYLGEESKTKQPDRYDFLKDEEIIEVGNIKIQVIDTPGHRKGHICFLVDDKYLFTGDLLILKDGKVKPFYKLISSDFENQLESVAKIAKLENIEGLFTAHGGYTTNFVDAIKDWK